MIVVVLGVLDQASPLLMPSAGASARAERWRADDAFVASLERQLPHGAMVFQLPVVDFPEHGSVGRMSAHDLIKEGYLHSDDAAVERAACADATASGSGPRRRSRCASSCAA